MIVSENILKEIFLQLPVYKDSNDKDFPIRYEWGDQADLILFLKTIAGNKYPLIWLTSGEETVNRYNHSLTRVCRLLLVKESKVVTNRNPTVWNTEFENVLNPLLKNVITALEKSGVTAIVGDFTQRKEANYTEEDLTKVTDFSNVIVLDITIRFEEKANGQPKCINTIKFKGFDSTVINPPNEGGGEVDPTEPPCLVPVITPFADNQFTNAIFVTVGQTASFQIVASRNPTSYGIRVPFLTEPLEGLVIDETTGLVTFTPTVLTDVVFAFGFQAENNCGMTEIGSFIKVVQHDINTIQAPINATVSDINPPQFAPFKSFIFGNNLLAFMGTILRYEVWLNGPVTGNVYVLYKDYFGALLTNMLGFRGVRVDGITEGTYLVKSRLKDSSGNYSAFSDELIVNV
jgi:hypothetical protein